LARGGAEVQKVHGNHYTMLKGPNVKVLAKNLISRLDELDKKL